MYLAVFYVVTDGKHVAKIKEIEKKGMIATFLPKKAFTKNFGSL